MSETAAQVWKWFKCRCGNPLASFNSGARLWCGQCNMWFFEKDLQEISEE